MARVKVDFLEHVDSQKVTNISFIDYTKVITSAVKEVVDGKEVEVEPASWRIQLLLEKPISIAGATPIHPDGKGGKIPNVATNEVIIHVHRKIISKYNHEFETYKEDDGTTSGTYIGDCFLDVSNAGDIWLVDEPLSSYRTKQYDKVREQKAADARAKLETFRNRRKGGA